MKRIFLAAFISILFVSCEDDTPKPNQGCTADVATLTGKYRISKVQSTTGGVLVDVTAQFPTLAPCMAKGEYDLRADGTVVYTDPAECNEDNKGLWTVKNSLVTLSMEKPVVSFVSPVGDNCTTISIPVDNGSTSLKITLKRQ